MTAKEYIEKEINDEDFEIIWESEFSQPISLKEMAKYMEAYHKSKVEAISDEMIEKEFKYDDTRDSIVGAKWFKEQLLKQ